jgi:hypothetical protein
MMKFLFEPPKGRRKLVLCARQELDAHQQVRATLRAVASLPQPKGEGPRSCLQKQKTDIRERADIGGNA